MDDNNGELEELKIDRQLRLLNGKLDRISNQQTVGETEPAKSWRDVVNPLLIAAVVALVGAVWVLYRSVAVLQTSDSFQWETIKEMKGDLKEVQGKTFRGVDGYDKEEPARGH